MVKNTDKFRQAALHFQKYGYYTASPKGTTAYAEYWDEEIRRSLFGWTSDDGDFISGYHYFYLNYSPILIVTEREIGIGDGNKRTISERKRDFPRFYDYDYTYFNYIDEAERIGKHAVVIKARRKGYSFKAASMLCRNFYLIPESKSYAIASENEFLIKDGLLSKAWDLMSWLDKNTAWAKKRQVKNTNTHRRASMIVDVEGTKIETGILSEIIGITLKNDIQKARGKAAKLILWEEGGKFPGLKDAWQIARPSVEQDANVFGLMIAYGCVCEGTKIITNEGLPINIEKLTRQNGIIGYNTYSTVKQEIEHFREPYETQCYKITTNSGKSLEASLDHPIIYSHRTLSKRVPGKRNENLIMKSWKWKQLQDFKVGDQVGIIDEIGIFGETQMWNPRLIGWLIGDGSYGFDKTPRLSNCEDEINSYIDTHFNTVIEKEYQTKDSKRYREIRIKDICSKLRELGIYGQVKENKRLPDIIFSCTKEDVCELIGGLFDTDGYISNIKNKTSHKIILTSAYKVLLDQVSMLLLKLGIHGKIRFIKPNLKNPIDRNGYYRLEIADTKSLIAFTDNIIFFPKEKQRRLESYKESLKLRKSEISKYIHGLRFERVVSIEDIGLKKVYNISASETHTYIANGFITHNTGGTDEADYTGLKDLFYEPEGYNVLSVENIWDEGASKRCGFFVPEYANMGGTDEEGKPFMDKDGNTDMKVAAAYALRQRQKIIDNASDRSAIDRYIAEHPFNPMEATLQLSGNIFPKKDLIRHLAHIRNNENIRNFKQVGELVNGPGGSLEWKQSKEIKDIIRYKIDKSESRDGAIVIWEHPMINPPYGLYIAACDPYDHDKSGTDSLGSVFIYKRFQTFEYSYDTIVAEYTGRPDTAEEFYEIVRKLLVYYHANVLYENQNPGLSVYFRNKNIDYMLADQPDIISKIIKDSKVTRVKGTHMVTALKDWAEGRLRDWLIEEYEPGKKNLTKIYSEPLLEELIAYSDKGNFDRVSALFILMIYREELHQLHVKKKEEIEKVNLLFELPVFGKVEFESFK
jgi:intein/homing endonuclease